MLRWGRSPANGESSGRWPEGRLGEGRSNALLPLVLAGISAKPIFLVVMPELIVRQSQQLSRALLVPARVAQGAVDEPLLEGADLLLERDRRLLARRHLGREIARVDGRAWHRVDQTLDDALQLT